MWQGTDYNERLVNSVHNALVGIYLDGVTGVSPDRGHRQVSAADADRYIAKAQSAFAKLVVQKPPASVRSRHEHRVTELGRLLDKAISVRDGAPQKMTEQDYADRRKSLGMR